MLSSRVYAGIGSVRNGQSSFPPRAQHNRPKVRDDSTTFDSSLADRDLRRVSLAVSRRDWRCGTRADRTTLLANLCSSDRTVVDLSRWMYTYPRPEHVFPVVDWRDGFPVVTASRALVELVASQADPTFPVVNVESEALWDAIMLFRRFDVSRDLGDLSRV